MMHNKFLIIEARFYDHINDMLLEGVKSYLVEHNIDYETITVPGALEIPSALSFASRSNSYDAYIVLGCIIRGETGHYDVCVNESARGIYAVALANDLAVGNGILTVENEEQAIVRADPKQKNKGYSFAEAAHSLLKIKQAYV